MMKFECKESGTNNKYVAQGSTFEEVKKDALAYAQTVIKIGFLKDPHCSWQTL